MKRLLDHPYFLWASRWLLAGVFLVAAWYKITDLPAFASAIKNYDMVPVTWLPFFATGLAGLEAVVGLTLLFGLWRRGSGLWVSLMLLMFIGAIATAYLRGLSIECGCFTAELSVERASEIRNHMLLRLAEDVGMLLLSLNLWRSDSRPLA